MDRPSPILPSQRRHRPAASLLAPLALAAAGCTTTVIERPPVPVAIMRVSNPEEVFEVVRGEGERVGLVVRFEGDEPGRAHYMVRNIWHQDLGLIDHLGRAYRYVPHRPEPLWVGTGTVEEGVEEILGVDDCLLFELPFQAPGGPAPIVEDREAEPTGGAAPADAAPIPDS